MKNTLHHFLFDIYRLLKENVVLLKIFFVTNNSFNGTKRYLKMWSKAELSLGFLLKYIFKPTPPFILFKIPPSKGIELEIPYGCTWSTKKTETKNVYTEFKISNTGFYLGIIIYYQCLAKILIIVTFIIVYTQVSVPIFEFVASYVLSSVCIAKWNRDY